MRKQTRSSGWLAVATVWALCGSALASGPFTVRRSDSGATLDGSAPIATVLTAPFDETLARSIDESSYFYGVYDASGARLDISVQSMSAGGPIRIGFDDSNAASAPVGASQSTVVVTPDTVRADGVQASTITIAPRDATGFLLGRGLAVTIDAGFLWPLTLTGPVVDLGDGTYSASAVATTPGDGAVRVAVESVTLASSPAVHATALDPSSLRDLAILQLRDLTSDRGRFDVGSGPGAGSLASARGHALDALAILANGDPDRDDNALKNALDAALRDLGGVDDPTGEIADLANDLIEVARMIAAWHVDQAFSACGTCGGSGNAKRTCAAQTQLDAADAMPRVTPSDWNAAIDAYSVAVALAVQAEQSCR